MPVTKPHSARGAPNAPNATFLARHGSKILAGVAVFGAMSFYLTRRPAAAAGTVEGNILRTSGVQNIENAYRNAGATGTHTPAYGGTIQGDQTSEIRRDQSGTALPKGRSSQEHMGDDQRASRPGKFMQEFKELNHGDSRGK